MVVGVVVLVVLVAAAVAVFVARRGQGPTPSATPVPTVTSPSATTTTLMTAPLTGLPVTPGMSLDHPAVAIKISDVRQAHPQIGVDKADIVFTEPIGVAYTRLLAVFHSQLPSLVGPVRSVRPPDAPLLSPLEPVFGNTMGAPWVVSYVDSVGRLDDLGTLRVPRPGAYVLNRSRPLPDHVFVKPRTLMGLSKFTKPPAPYFSYAADLASASASSAVGAGTSAVVPYGAGFNMTWRYDAARKRYLRSEPWGPHTTLDGIRVSATNVLVLKVSSSLGKIGTDPGDPVPILKLTDGSGRFVALAGGHSVAGAWSKGPVTDTFVLRTDSGQPLLLAPGNTWVEMPGAAATVTIR
ncbi:hypothetical protein N865_20950 [Intrasporangium oryzae NRRL B-24470]|uniref:DUF3048 domain-containing protein n=2 Tax=Intrasporangium TaxID=53357 RepID=W9G0Y4_9MICO|nr:hypothetical protein N865_20950 [Intrasporangium oryzae NRRL B-24470]